MESATLFQTAIGITDILRNIAIISGTIVTFVFAYNNRKSMRSLFQYVSNIEDRKELQEIAGLIEKILEAIRSNNSDATRHNLAVCVGRIKGNKNRFGDELFSFVSKLTKYSNMENFETNEIVSLTRLLSEVQTITKTFETQLNFENVKAQKSEATNGK